MSGKCRVEPGVPRLPMMALSSATQSSSSTRRFHSRAEPAAGGQYPGHLGHGPFRVHPVPRLGHQHRVHAVIGQRDLLAGAAEYGHPGHRAAQLLAHARRRFHGDHVQAALTKLAGQLPGAGADVGHPGGVRRDQPVDRLGRIRTAGPARRCRRPRRKNWHAPGAIRRAPYVQSASRPARACAPAGAGRYARAVRAQRRRAAGGDTWNWRTTGVSCCAPRQRTTRRWRSPTSGASSRPGSTTT